MFFDLSIKKVVPMFLLIVFFFAAVWGFLFFNGATSLRVMMPIYFQQKEFAFFYWLQYKAFDRSGAANPSSGGTGTVAGVATALAGSALSGGISLSGSASASGAARSVPVLLYHGESSASIQLPHFIDSMRALKQDGWRTITVEQFDQFMKGEITLPDKSFLLTFDDGRKDSYYPVDPVLADLGFHAVMFVITGFSLPDNGKTSNFYLSRAELQQMQSSGRWELESHGKEDHRWYQVPSLLSAGTATSSPGHFLSNKFFLGGGPEFETDQEFQDRITNDLTEAKTTLEDDFNIPIIAYAFPFNDFGQDTVNFPGAEDVVSAVVPGIYSLAFYQTSLTNGETYNYPDPSAYMIKRIEPDPTWGGAQLLSILDEGRVKDLPFNDANFSGEWNGDWGTIVSRGSLVLTASTNTSGAAAFLLGSRPWTDYIYTAVASWNAGSEFSLIARRHDSGNYFACTFSAARVVLEEHLQGNVRTVAFTPNVPLPAPDVSTPISISVQGNTAGCMVNGVEVVHGVAMSPALRSGGIGVQVWNGELGVAGATIHKVTVAPLP